MKLKFMCSYETSVETFTYNGNDYISFFFPLLQNLQILTFVPILMHVSHRLLPKYVYPYICTCVFCSLYEAVISK